MHAQELIVLAVKLSIILAVLSIGLSSSIAALTGLFHQPVKLAKSLLAIDLVMPLIAIALVLLLPSLPTPVKFVLIAISVAPIPPLLPNRTAMATSSSDFTVGLLAAVGAVAIVFVPTAIAVIGPIVGVTTDVTFASMAALLLMMVLAPLLAGAAIHARWPAFADRVADPLGKIALGLLVIALLPVLYIALPHTLAMARGGAVLALGTFVLAGLAVGHVLGGPDPEERTVLGLATATRHPGVTLAVASATYPAHQKEVLVAIALYFLVNIVLGVPYTIWRKRRRTTNTGHHPAE